MPGLCNHLWAHIENSKLSWSVSTVAQMLQGRFEKTSWQIFVKAAITEDVVDLEEYTLSVDSYKSANALMMSLLQGRPSSFPTRNPG